MKIEFESEEVFTFLVCSLLAVLMFVALKGCEIERDHAKWVKEIQESQKK